MKKEEKIEITGHSLQKLIWIIKDPPFISKHVMFNDAHPRFLSIKFVFFIERERMFKSEVSG